MQVLSLIRLFRGWGFHGFPLHTPYITYSLYRFGWVSASSNYRAFYGRRQPRSMPGHGVVRHGLLNTVQENSVLLEGHLETTNTTGQEAYTGKHRGS